MRAAVIVAWLVVGLLMAGLLMVGSQPRPLTVESQESCYLNGERISGQNRICHYSCPSGGAAMTVPAWQTCPLRVVR